MERDVEAEDERSIRESIRIINGELGLLWRSVAALERDVDWIKAFLWKFTVPILVGIFLAVVGVLLKLLIG